MTGKTIHKGIIVSLIQEEATLPNGHRMTFEIVKHPGGAAVVAVNDKREVCMLRQYRHVVGDWIWEIPAGKLEPDEPPRTTAGRELVEEAGREASEWESLGSMLSSPGIFSEEVHLYLATGLTEVPHNLQEDEVLEVHWWPMKKALQAATDGTINDAKSVIGLFRAASRMGITAD